MNSNELIFCGEVTKRIEHARPLLLSFLQTLVTLEVRSEDGFVSRYSMQAKHCYGITVGQFVRIKRSGFRNAFASEESRLFAISAPAPKPRVIGRGYLLRITRRGASVRLEDASVIEVDRCNMRGLLQEGAAVRLMAYHHGWLDQYRERYIDLDTSRPAWIGLANT